MNFEEALRQLKAGKKIRTPNMRDKSFLTINKCTDEIVEKEIGSDIECTKFLSGSALMRDDWEIVNDIINIETLLIIIGDYPEEITKFEVDYTKKEATIYLTAYENNIRKEIVNYKHCVGYQGKSLCVKGSSNWRVVIIPFEVGC